jgi:hypothetical protein
LPLCSARADDECHDGNHRLAANCAASCPDLIAAVLIGFNRGGHGEPAGLRTTLLVCLAAWIDTLQANLLGRGSNSGPRRLCRRKFQVLRGTKPVFER